MIARVSSRIAREKDARATMHLGALIIVNAATLRAILVGRGRLVGVVRQGKIQGVTWLGLCVFSADFDDLDGI